MLYRSHVGVLPCNGYTLHFKLQSQATLLLDVASIALGDHLHKSGVYGAISLCCEPFQGTSWCARWPEGMPATPQPTVYAETHSSRFARPPVKGQAVGSHFGPSPVLPVQSPLLKQSQLLAGPPLSDMLNFSGYSRVVEGKRISLLSS